MSTNKSNHSDNDYNYWGRHYRILKYLDNPGFIGHGEATEMLINIEADSERYLDTPKRYASYCNLRDSVELSNRINGGSANN